MPDGVVITGLGVVSPIGIGEDAFWSALCAGRSGAGPVDGLDTSALPRSVACQIRTPLDRDPALGRAAQLAIAAAQQAVGSARLRPSQVDPGRAAVTVGTTMGETDFIEQRLAADPGQWLTAAHMRRIATGRPGTIARHVRHDLGVSGPAIDLYGACAAGNMALSAALRDLRAGRYDVALAGGADGFSRLAFIGFMRLRIMAQEVCRPFDRNRDGLLVGEGAAMFVLERESHARARGAPVRARVLGGANTSESFHPARPDPSGDGLTRAIQGALANAGVRPADIGYICAHGTATPQNDAIEVDVMQRCFPQGVPFNSVKALTGHTMGAASAMEAVCCVLSLEHQMLIPTWNLENPIPTGNLEVLRDKPRPASPRCALNNAAGFGGYNSCVVLAAA